MKNPRRYVIKVTGKVQGVFFRQSTAEKARELGLKGFARNEPDGSVHIEAEGDPSRLQLLVEWAHEGPPAARVASVTYNEHPLQGYEDFGVRH